MVPHHTRWFFFVVATCLLMVGRPGYLDGTCRAANIVFVVDDDGIIDGVFDQDWAARLTGQGHNVISMGDGSPPTSEPGAELFIVSNDVGSGNILNNVTDWTADLRPVINYEAAATDVFGMSDADADHDANMSMNIDAAGHNIVDGLSSPFDVYSGGTGRMLGFQPGAGINPQAQVVTTRDDGEPSIVVMEAGTTLVGEPAGQVAGGLRISGFMQDSQDFSALSADGLTLLDNLVAFALGAEPPVPGDVNGDGAADLLDFEIIRVNFGIGATREEGDLDFNNLVGLSDFKIWKQAAFPPGGAPVPEPSTLGLVVLALSLALACRVERKRNDR